MQYYVNPSDEFDLADVEIELLELRHATPTHLYHKPISVVYAKWEKKREATSVHTDISLELTVLKLSAKMVVHNPDSVMDGTWNYTPEEYQKMLRDIDTALVDF